MSFRMLTFFFCTRFPPPNSHLKPPGRCPISASHFSKKIASHRSSTTPSQRKWPTLMGTPTTSPFTPPRNFSEISVFPFLAYDQLEFEHFSYHKPGSSTPAVSACSTDSLSCLSMAFCVASTHWLRPCKNLCMCKTPKQSVSNSEASN